ncbi:MAG: hypothetical protein ACREJN_16565, partial [Nitrospiraceae bacterium]
KDSRLMSGSQQAQPSSTSLLNDSILHSLICENTYHHHHVVSILLKNCTREQRASAGIRGAAGKDLLPIAVGLKHGKAINSKLAGEQRAPPD